MSKELTAIDSRDRTEFSDLYQQVDFASIPYHVAIIMDGNGRWAKAKAIPRIQGHREGVRSVDEVVSCAREIGVKMLTLYAFSKENWHRPKAEINALMFLLKEFIVIVIYVEH